MNTDTSKKPPASSAEADTSDDRPVTDGRWLLLIHQLPTRPSKARVKTWRRLQQIGAVAIRNAVYVLPDSAQAREDFEWMKAEVLANQGQATIFAADTIDALTHDDIVRAFRADRERAFEAIRADAQKLIRSGVRAGGTRGTKLRQLQRAVRQLRSRFAQVAAGDFFGAGGREEANAAVDELERLLTGPGRGLHDVSPSRDVLAREDYRDKTWVTRPRPGIDRTASAWLIQRFIDSGAHFVFGARPPRSSSTWVPFDMYDAEFSHHGDQCTFEVLSQRFGIADPAVARLGRLVHDLDLKETRYQVPEAATVALLIDGLRQAYSRDEELLEHGIVMFEALYRSLAGDLAPVGPTAPIRRRRGRGRKGR